MCLQPGSNDSTTVQLAAQQLPEKWDGESLTDESINMFIWVMTKSFVKEQKKQYMSKALQTTGNKI